MSLEICHACFSVLSWILAASATVVGGSAPTCTRAVARVHVCGRPFSRSRRKKEKHIADVPEPQIMEEILEAAAKDTLQERISERMRGQTVDQLGDQVCREPTESIHRHGCRHACGDATTGPSKSDGVEDRGRPWKTSWRSSSAELWRRL